MNWGKEMKLPRSPACAAPNGRIRQKAIAVCHMAFVISAFAALSGCEQNSFVPPPPPKVDVGLPMQQNVTRYLDATGNTAPIQSVDLVARVQGVLQSINYKDGSFVKQGTTLFTIEPETYKLKLEQAQAAEAGSQASLKQAEADYKRQAELVARQAVSQATLDTSTSNRDNAQANLQQAQANTKIAAINYGYTDVVAPFDGIVSAHLVSAGELVGAASPTQLATIVQLDPIYVNFNVNEQDVPFVVLKFRTMRQDAEKNGAVWAVKNDARVTPLGRFMRTTRLDEIPQLWNVLRGDMAFVGPRPERPEFVQWLTNEIPYYHVRHIIRPGITGWAQVRYQYGASLEETKRKLEYDLYYIKHLSIGLDLLIIFETVKTIISRRGAQ